MSFSIPKAAQLEGSDAHWLNGRLSGDAAAWVHAYLHRREGDLANAGYWYRRAGRDPGQGELEQEWAEIARALLDSSP